MEKAAINTRRLKLVLLYLMLCITTPVAADSEELCAPFKDTAINRSMMELMLQAATDGNLYRIKPGSSKMGFCINSPVGKIEAEFHSFKGGLALNDFMQQGTSLIHIDVESLETNSGFIESMLKSDSFLDSEQYPGIVFVSTGIEWIKDRQGVLKGDLTMHGVTKAVAFYVELKKTETTSGEEALTIKASTTIQRTEFNMHTLVPIVDDRVTLCMSIAAYRYDAKLSSL